MCALIIEDGTGVDNADSYATLVEVRAYALARGVNLSAVDATVEVLLRKACDYLDSLETRYKGARVDSEQALAWPRSDVFILGSETEFPNDGIPSQLVKAQCQLAMDGVTLDLLPNGTGREVVRVKVDVLETEYAKQGTGSLKPELNKALAILEPLLASGGMSVQSVRV